MAGSSASDDAEASGVPGPARAGRAWSPPRILDHGSLRHFVRDVSGSDSDGSAMGVGGMMMFTMT